MITFIEIRPNSGSPIELNTLDYPLSVCDIFTNIDVRGYKKPFAPGEWPSFNYPGALSAHVEGTILGSGATPSNDYVTKRLALADAVLPPIQTLTSRQHGILRIRLDGMSENADAPVVVQSISMPLRALYPANSEFMIQWKGFTPYFTGVSSSTKYQLG